MSIHQNRIQNILSENKPLSERAKDIVEYFETVDADNIYFSFNSARNTGSHSCTVTISKSNGENEMVTVNF